ncbi:MAG TPA: hypothetical protein VGX23_05580 [Actinocrinis sp.]|nr:hypothetical protein [Actinocrinis sp.]
MPKLYFLDVAEFAGVAAVAAAQPGVRAEQVGGYLVVSADGPVVVDRRTAGVRQAVWYSSLAGLSGGRVTQFDKDALRVEPVGAAGSADPTAGATAAGAADVTR